MKIEKLKEEMQKKMRVKIKNIKWNTNPHPNNFILIEIEKDGNTYSMGFNPRYFEKEGVLKFLKSHIIQEEEPIDMEKVNNELKDLKDNIDKEIEI